MRRSVELARRRPAGATKRGPRRTTTEEERTLAALLERQLHELGLDRARVTAVATKPGQGADLRFERIPAADVDLLKKALGRCQPRASDRQPRRLRLTCD